MTRWLGGFITLTIFLLILPNAWAHTLVHNDTSFMFLLSMIVAAIIIGGLLVFLLRRLKRARGDLFSSEHGSAPKLNILMILAGCFIILVIVLAWFPLIRSKRKFKPMWATPCKSFCKKLWDTINAGRTWKGDFINRKKNGEEFWESASISPIKNSEGEITHFVAVKQDITERKQLEEELIRARQAADRIRDAVEMGDVTRIKSIVEDLISKSDAVASLGDKFIQMAADFDFDGVLKLADQLAIEVKTT